MKLCKSNLNSIFETVEKIKNNDVVIIPTDTVYGFSGIVPEADFKIRKIKGREETKPFIQLIGKPEDISLYTKDFLPNLLTNLWPGPLTIIVNNLEGGTTAFRCPGDSWLREVIIKSGKPIYSTSVNRSGYPVFTKICDIEKEFENEVALIIDDGDSESSVPSTIVAIENGKCKIIRQGAINIPESLL